MQSLFLKIFLCFFLTVVAVGIAFALPVAAMLVMSNGGMLKTATISFPFLAFGVSVFICLMITRHITLPLFELRGAADRIAEGNLAARVPSQVRNRRDEIGQLGRDFDRMAERLEALVDGHKRLLGDVSHELRSPLSRLLVALGLARKGGAQATPQLLDRLALQANRRGNLIGQLLTLSRIQSGSHDIPASSIDLTNLVHEIVNDAAFEAQAHGKHVGITASDECTVSAAEELLRSAIENVIRNAVRYTRPGSSVDVSIRRERQSAMIRVRDRGPGVPETMLSEIFLPFRRVPAAEGTPNEGSGLGLAIAYRAVAMTGGNIRAINAADGGLIVEIGLPTD